jgi:sugar phosphate isomerase/epimerase
MARQFPAGMTIVFPTVPLEPNLALQARLGFSGVEVWKPHLGPRIGPRMLADVGRHARDLGVPITALNAIGEAYFEPFGGELAYLNTLEGLKRDIDICHHLGVDTLAVWEGRPESGHDLAWHVDILTRLFTKALDIAEGSGLRSILFEPHPFTVGFTLGGVPELCTAVGRNRLGIILDTCHLSVAYPQQYLAQLKALTPFVHHLHLGDSDLETSELHYPPGRGLVDLPACMRALADGGFRGTVAWDLYSWPFPEQAIREHRADISNLLATLDAGATQV